MKRYLVFTILLGLFGSGFSQSAKLYPVKCEAMLEVSSESQLQMDILIDIQNHHDREIYIVHPEYWFLWYLTDTVSKGCRVEYILNMGEQLLAVPTHLSFHDTIHILRISPNSHIAVYAQFQSPVPLPVTCLVSINPLLNYLVASPQSSFRDMEGRVSMLESDLRRDGKSCSPGYDTLIHFIEGGGYRINQDITGPTKVKVFGEVRD